MGAKVSLIVRAVEQEPGWDEVLGDELLDGWMRIRHGIQRNASGSVVTAKIRYDETTFAGRSRQHSCKIVLPRESNAIHRSSARTATLSAAVVSMTTKLQQI